MAAAPAFYDKTDEQKAILEMVRQFVDEQILPQAEHYDAVDEFPEPIVAQMRELGLFGVTIPEEHGGMGLDLTTYAMIVEELSRGLDLDLRDRQHALHRLLPADEVRHARAAGAAVAEDGDRRDPGGVLDERAGAGLRRGRDQGVGEQGPPTATTSSTGAKMWVTNGLLSGVVFVLMRTDREASPPHRGLTCFIAEKEPGASREPGPDRPAEDQEARLQGRRVHRAGLRRLPLPRGHDPRRRGGGPEQGLRADDGRAGGRPRQRRRPRRRASRSARWSWG